MIAIQGYKNSNKSITILFDANGIDEFINYLNFIKSKDASMHLNIGNELADELVYDNEMFIIPHLKIINLDRI
jgi:hypothetical protein